MHRFSFEPAVQIINPWTGNIMSILSWDEVEQYGKENIKSDLSVWLDQAKSAFNNSDGRALGLMLTNLK